jgi:hypothetical protein
MGNQKLKPFFTRIAVLVLSFIASATCAQIPAASGSGAGVVSGAAGKEPNLNAIFQSAIASNLHPLDSQFFVVSASLKSFVYAGSVYLYNINLKSESGKSGFIPQYVVYHCCPKQIGFGQGVLN